MEDTSVGPVRRGGPEGHKKRLTKRKEGSERVGIQFSTDWITMRAHDCDDATPIYQIPDQSHQPIRTNHTVHFKSTPSASNQQIATTPTLELTRATFQFNFHWLPGQPEGGGGHPWGNWTFPVGTRLVPARCSLVPAGSVGRSGVLGSSGQLFFFFFKWYFLVGNEEHLTLGDTNRQKCSSLSLSTYPLPLRPPQPPTPPLSGVHDCR